jgi:hypothetical protein
VKQPSAVGFPAVEVGGKAADVPDAYVEDLGGLFGVDHVVEILDQ